MAHTIYCNNIIFFKYFVAQAFAIKNDHKHTDKPNMGELP